MRQRLRILAGVLVGGGAILLPAGPATAAPKALCSVDDERLAHVSGIAATPDGYAVVNDGTSEPATTKVYMLDRACQVTGTLTSENKPRDPEDLIRTADGTLWAADIGDATGDRERIAVHVFPPSGEPTIHRMTYPDGRHDAKAMFVQKGNIPVVVTWDKSGVAKVYVATAPITGPSSDEAVPLRAAGTITFEKTDTPAHLGAIGTTVVTGAALSPDGRRAVLRTYSDAYEWDVPDGDVAKAIVNGKRRRTPLPGEKAQEAITFTADGSSYVTAGRDAPSSLQQWAPAAPSGPPKAAKKSEPGFVWSLSHITALIVGLGVVGLALLGAGLLGIVRFRRAQAAGGPPVETPARKPLAGRRHPKPVQPAAVHETVALPRVPGAVYGRRPEDRGAAHGKATDAAPPTRIVPPTGSGAGAVPGPATPRGSSRRGRVYGPEPDPEVPPKGPAGGRGSGSPAYRPGVERPSQAGGRRDDADDERPPRDWRAGRSGGRTGRTDDDDPPTDGGRRRPRS